MIKKKKNFSLADRRITQRLKLQLKLRYCLIHKRKIIGEAFTKDLSGGGMRFFSLSPLKTGTIIQSQLFFPNQNKPIEIKNRVIRCKKIVYRKKETYELGLSHIKIEKKDQQRFMFLFCEMMINYFILGEK
ncbi:MAG: PilZ domain-containing protein [Candidatus Omnitrophica bacterium]|nr:PilZ domain-containing protein [Candidatus Omnitrophota bacterium]